MSTTKKIKYPSDWINRKKEGQKISVITAYDSIFASLIKQTSIDSILIGDSLGTTVQGRSSTIPVSMNDMVYHCSLVSRATKGDTFLIGDLPFGSYQTSVTDGIKNAFRLMKEGQVHAVKLEGSDEHTLELIRRLVSAGIPVMGHAGLTPQSYLTLGGYRVQGRSEDQASELIDSAMALEDAGCFALVLELVSAPVAASISDRLKIPTIGIGSGVNTDGQVLVLADMLGLDPDFNPRHSRMFAELGRLTLEALENYHNDVTTGDFPSEENSFS